jgi:hypothetical protein
VASLGAVVLALVVTIVISPRTPAHDCSFDEAGWRASRAAPPLSRDRFERGERAVGQLVGCGEILGGRSPSEVSALLGNAGRGSYEGGRRWVYETGAPADFGSGTTHLEITFGPSGVVDHAAAMNA